MDTIKQLNLKLKKRANNGSRKKKKKDGAESDGSYNRQETSSTESYDAMAKVKNERDRQYRSMAPDRGRSNLHYDMQQRAYSTVNTKPNILRKFSLSTSELASDSVGTSNAPLRGSSGSMTGKPLLDVFRPDIPVSSRHRPRLNNGLDAKTKEFMASSPMARSESHTSEISLKNPKDNTTAPIRIGNLSVVNGTHGNHNIPANYKGSGVSGSDSDPFLASFSPSRSTHADRGTAFQKMNSVGNNVSVAHSTSSTGAVQPRSSALIGMEHVMTGKDVNVSNNDWFYSIMIHPRTQDGKPSIRQNTSSTQPSADPRTHFYLFSQSTRNKLHRTSKYTPTNNPELYQNNHNALKPESAGVPLHTSMSNNSPQLMNPSRSPGKINSSSATLSRNITKEVDASRGYDSRGTTNQGHITSKDSSGAGPTTGETSGENSGTVGSSSYGGDWSESEDKFPRCMCVALPVTPGNNMMSIFSVCFSFFMRGELLQSKGRSHGDDISRSPRSAISTLGRDDTNQNKHGVMLGDELLDWENIPAGSVKGKILSLREPLVIFALQSDSIAGPVLGLAGSETIYDALADILTPEPDEFSEQRLIIQVSGANSNIADNALFLSKDVSVLNGLTLYLRPIATPTMTAITVNSPTPAMKSRKSSTGSIYGVGNGSSTNFSSASIPATGDAGVGTGVMEAGLSGHSGTPSVTEKPITSTSNVNSVAGASSVINPAKSYETQRMIEGVEEQMILIDNMKEHLVEVKDNLNAVTQVSNFLTDQIENKLNVALQEMKQRQSLAINSLNFMRSERAEIRDRISRVEQSVGDLNNYFTCHAKRLDKVVRRMEAFMMRRRIGMSTRMYWIALCLALVFVYKGSCISLLLIQVVLTTLRLICISALPQMYAGSSVNAINNLKASVRRLLVELKERSSELFATTLFFFEHAEFEEGSNIEDLSGKISELSEDSVHYPHASDYAFCLMICLLTMFMATVSLGY
eukprot:CFRG0622T1